MLWAVHRHAPWYLMGLSFAESSFFPVPPDVMLAPMSLADTGKAWQYAALTSIASVLGGVLGYLIGSFAFEMISPWIASAGYSGQYDQVVLWFERWGVWAILIAGFTPIPYKLFTIAAGVISMAFLPFILASFVGRSARFFMVAGLMVWGGESMEKNLRRYVDIIGWTVLVLLVMIIAYAQTR